ncbi:MAG: glycosyltransferase [Solirubrobacteraceae bacterium]
MSEAAAPVLTVVVGSNGSPGSVERCLAALEPQRDGAQVIVCEPTASPPAVQERFGWAQWLEQPGALVPELWREGIDRSAGRIVALTISPMEPAPDWLNAILAEHGRHDAVAGAIETGERLRLVDWAEYFCRYAKDMRPFEPHETVDLPGDNATYKRELLERTRELYRDGFWEPVIHRRLAEEGIALWQSPLVVVRQGRSAGAGAFASQRLHHGRAHGRQRGEHFSAVRNLAGALGAPLVPGLLALRVLQTVFGRGRHRVRALLALPWMAWFNVAWAAGEARGHLDALVGARSSALQEGVSPEVAASEGAAIDGAASAGAASARAAIGGAASERPAPAGGASARAAPLALGLPPSPAAGTASSPAGTPQLSVVVASVNGFPYLGRCLDALAGNAPEAEAVVADWTDEETRARVRKGWPQVTLLSFDEPMAVPELRAAGIAAARAPYVAVIEDHCVVHRDWSRAIVAAHEAGYPVVGGPVRNAAGRLRDWAAFFVEYADFMEPLNAGEVPGLTGMNVSYDRHAIEAMQPLLDEGRWESWLHPHLASEGMRFRADPAIALDHIMRFDVSFFVSQRYHYARSHAGARNPELGIKRIAYLGGSPLIVPLMYARTARAVLGKRRHRLRFFLTTPLILFYMTVWAWGEAVGYALGGGRSLLKVR